MQIQKTNFNMPKQSPSFKSVRVNADDTDLLIKIFRSTIKDTKKMDGAMTLLQSNAYTISKNNHWVDPTTKAFIQKDAVNDYVVLSTKELRKIDELKSIAAKQLHGEIDIKREFMKYLDEFSKIVNELGASMFLKEKVSNARPMDREELVKLSAKVKNLLPESAEKAIDEAFS